MPNEQGGCQAHIAIRSTGCSPHRPLPAKSPSFQLIRCWKISASFACGEACVLQLSSSADAVSALIRTGKVGVRSPFGDDPEIAVPAVKVGKHCMVRRSSQSNYPFSITFRATRKHSSACGTPQ